MDLVKLELISARLIGIRSTIHNEKQLSAIELMAMLSKKTNELIDCVNQIIDEVKNVTAPEVKMTENYNPTSESLELVPEVN